MGVRFGRFGVAVAAALVILGWPGTVASAATPNPHVLLVCNNSLYKCPTQVAGWRYFSTIQDAVNASVSNDWILVWPGDYREKGTKDSNNAEHSAGLWITHPGIFLRGMDSRLVVVDGTNSGPECSSATADQNWGPTDPSTGKPAGRDGIEVWKADDTWLENLMACNFLTSADGHHGNEIWWNGGDGSGTIGLHSYWGDYVAATSTYSSGPKGNDNPRGEYGIFTSNSGNDEKSSNAACGDVGTTTTANGNCYTGFMNHSYANNMGDAAFYIGACPNCQQILENSRGENSALGFSGTNAGGDFLIRNTEFVNNKTGLTSNSQNNDDQPSPQDGSCPSGESPPPQEKAAGATGCTIFEHNLIHDNNNPNVPGVGQGLSGGAPVGTGAVIAGDRFTTVYANQFWNNGAWGVLVTDEPDFNESPPSYATYCRGGSLANSAAGTCWYQVWGNATIANRLWHNGRDANPTNGDIALIEPIGAQLGTFGFPPPLATATPDDATKPGNCFTQNVDPVYGGGKLKSDPPPFPFSESPSTALQTTPAPAGWGTCGHPPPPNSGNSDPVLVAQAACNTQLLFPCPANAAANYPQQTKVNLMSLSATRTRSFTMANPCGPDSWGQAPPPNPWCPYTGPSSNPPATSSSGSGAVSGQSTGQPNLPGTGGQPADAVRPLQSQPGPFGLALMLAAAVAATAIYTLRRRSRSPVAQRVRRR